MTTSLLRRIFVFVITLLPLSLPASYTWATPPSTLSPELKHPEQKNQEESRDQSAPKLNVEVSKERLPNGLTLLMSPDHRVPTIAVEIRYLVGSAHEREGRSGFAHLFEHLMFQGSKNYDQEYFTPFTPIGGKVNGTTSNDRTNYHEQVPAEALELALWMESDRMENLLEALTQAKLDNQRDVVKNERRQRYENTPYGMVWKIFANELYPVGHPYQHTTIGSHEDLSAATLDDVKDFFKRYYVPSNAIVTLVGDFDPKEARALVYRYFAHLPSGSRAPTPKATSIPELGERTVTLTDQVKLPRVYLAWHTPALYASGDAEMDLLSTLLSDGKSSALYQPLVFEQQLAKDVFAFQMSRALGSVFVIGATAAPGKDLDELTLSLRREVKKALQAPVPPLTFERALNGWRKSFYSRIESVMSRAQQISTYDHFLNRPDGFVFDLKRYTSLTPKQVADAAQHWLGRSPLTVRVIPTTSAHGSPDRSAPPPLTSSKPWSPPQVEQFTTKQGINVWLVPQHQSPLISLKLMINQGAAADPFDRAGLTSLMASLLDEGAGERDAIQVSDALQLLATDYGVTVTQDHITLSMDLLAEKLTPSLDLLSDFVVRPRFTARDFERVRKQRVAAAIAQSANPRSARNVVLKRVLFGTGYAGLPSDGLPDTLRSIKLSEIKSVYQSHIKPRGATLIVVGDIERPRLEQELNRALSTWSGETRVRPRKVEATKRVAAIHWIDFPGSTQSALALARAVKPTSDQAAQVHEELFNLVFGGKFTSRLNLNLREDKGYTYGAYSGLYHLRHAGFHYIGAMVKGDTTFLSTQEMIKELTEIGTSREVSIDELNKVRGGEIKGYPAQFESRGKIVGQLADLSRHDKRPRWLKEWLTYLEKTQLDEVNRSAKRLALTQEYHIVVAGDLKAHLEQFKSLGRPIIIYSPEGKVLNKIQP
jgi:zinc protease